MLKNPYIKLSFVVIALFVALGFAFSGLEGIRLNDFKSPAGSMTNTDRIDAQPSEGSMDEPKSPAYFSIFKFISNFAPGKK